MNQEVKSEHFTVKSAKRVVIFQASLKLVRKEARAQLSSRNNKHLTSHGSNHLK